MADHCTIDNDREPPLKDAPLKRLTKLTPVPTAEVVNFGSRRGEKHVEMLFNAQPHLPPTVKPGHFTLGVPRSFRRNEGDKLATTTFNAPRFTEPSIRLRGRQVAVTACLSADGVKAGAYQGQINVSGPPRLAVASVDVTANLKNVLFFPGLAAALIAALILMIYRSAKTLKKANERLRDAARRAIDVEFWFTSLFSLLAGAIAAAGIYVGDVAWGDDAWPSLVALASTTLTAAGVQNLIATARGK